MKTSRRAFSALLTAFLVVVSGVQASTAQATQTLTVEGVEFTWPDQVYAPQSSEESTNSYFEVSYVNKSGSDFYYVGYSTDEPSGAPFLVFAIKLGVKNGTTGVLAGKMSYMYFLNFTGPGKYPLTLCAKKSLETNEVCAKSVVTFVTTKPAPPQVIAPPVASPPVTPPVITQTQPPVAKAKKTITCVKGKLTKKVTAVNPKCPKGYKKK
jgi:hypothetical protein